MMCRTPIQLLAGLAMILGTAASEAQATVITFAFSGTITSVSDPGGILGDALGVGNPFDGVYSFESTTPDSDPHGRRGLYLSALSTLTGQVADIPFAGPTGFGSFVEVQNDYASPTLDWYRVMAEVDFLGRTLLFTLSLLDSAGNALDDDLLPVNPPDLGSFDSAVFSIGSESVGFGFWGDLPVLMLVPEPSSLLLIGLPAILLLGVRRTGRRRVWRHAPFASKVLLVLFVFAVGRTVEAADCNTNGVDDAVDIAGGTSQDCNSNGIPDECAVSECPAVELVFVVDRSDSMGFGDDIAFLCNVADDVTTDLAQDALIVAIEFLDIGTGGLDVPCSCCEGSVPNIYGLSAPGLPEACG